MGRLSGCTTQCLSHVHHNMRSINWPQFATGWLCESYTGNQTKFHVQNLFNRPAYDQRPNKPHSGRQIYQHHTQQSCENTVPPLLKIGRRFNRFFTISISIFSLFLLLSPFFSPRAHLERAQYTRVGLTTLEWSSI